MLSATGISQGYGRETILKDFDLEIGPGVTALLGPNGSGKTTLLNTLSTVLPPKQGELRVNGRLVNSEKSARQVRRDIGFLPQRFGYDPTTTVRDFVRYGAWLRGIPSIDWENDVEEAVSYVGMASSSKTKLGKLSGGMRQRAGIALAIVGRPSVVLLDEPTVGLDPEQRVVFRQLVGGLTTTTVLLSTHLTDDVDAACPSVAVLNQGQIVFHGTTDALRLLASPGSGGHSAVEQGYLNLLTTRADAR